MEQEYDEKGLVTKQTGPYFPVEKQHKIPTLDKPLIIESAFPGWIPIAINPHIPLETKKVSEEIIASIKAGAAAIHVHPRDPKDGLMRMDPELLAETLDPVFEVYPDVITWNHSWTGKVGHPVDYKIHTQQIIEAGKGTKYIQCSVVLIKENPGHRDRIMVGDVEAMKEGTQWLEENGVKPIFQIYDTAGIEFLAEEIIGPGLAKWKPFMCCIHMGKHHSSYIGKDPWSYLQLITSLNALKDTIPGCITGLRAGGRNWLPITVAAIAFGIDMVGIGMEDCLWMYPHKDEIMKKNSEVIDKIVTIARELGRDIATPDQVRSILNLKKP